MIRKISTINVILFLLVCFLGFKAYAVWTDGSREIPQEAERASGEEKAPRPFPQIAQRDMPPEVEYEVVAEKNLFAEDRREPENDQADGGDQAGGEDKQASANPVSEDVLKQIKLYGIVMVDDMKSALVQHPPASDLQRMAMDPRMRMIRYRQRRTSSQLELSWVKVGDSLEAFKVADILADRVLLTDGIETYEVLLYDSENPKDRGSAKQQKEPTTPTVLEVKPGESAEAAPASAEEGRRGEAAAPPAPSAPTPPRSVGTPPAERRSPTPAMLERLKRMNR